MSSFFWVRNIEHQIWKCERDDSLKLEWNCWDWIMWGWDWIMSYLSLRQAPTTWGFSTGGSPFRTLSMYRLAQLWCILHSSPRKQMPCWYCLLPHSWGRVRWHTNSLERWCPGSKPCPFLCQASLMTTPSLLAPHILPYKLLWSVQIQSIHVLILKNHGFNNCASLMHTFSIQ